MVKSIYNFFSEIYQTFQDINNQDGECVDITNGKMSIDKVMEIALSTTKEKEFVKENGEPGLTAEAPILFHFTRRHQLVWFVNFNHYFTEEEHTNFESGVKSMTLAKVQIDDATGKVIFADWTRPFFNRE